MNEEQKLRLDLLGACGYNIEAARKCWDFVRGEANQREQCKSNIRDGIYLIDECGIFAPFDSKEWDGIRTVTHIGIIQGNHSVAIALQDVSEGEITLITGKGGGKSRYIDNYMDAIQDWDGKGNTERLKQIRLNPAIQLKDGEYIPTLAELYLICLNRKVINAAMRFVGGQELAGWYWSSTEYSATNAWYLNFNSGYANSINPKAVGTFRVRPVKKFL